MWTYAIVNDWRGHCPAVSQLITWLAMVREDTNEQKPSYRREVT